LEQNGDFMACTVQLSKTSEPVLGCSRTKEHSNATLTCLGGLSEEHLLALSHTLSGKLTLNLTACSGCPNSSMVPHLLQRLEVLSEAGLLEGGCSIFTAESAQDIRYKEESVDRRGFFMSFRNALFQGATVIRSAGIESTERRTEYTGKRVPVRRELLNRVRNKSFQELLIKIEKKFDATILPDARCITCLGCVAICPTGALQAEQADVPPVFDHVICTGCCLCAEFCLENALRISAAHPA
jgi:formate hydrogenlyase subunit 6/NADH:ubiquinone oxidoreductase subunit I